MLLSLSRYAASHSACMLAQDIETEMAGLPGHFALPGGAILLASDGGKDAGCVALRPAMKEAVSNSTCVMKRLYVRPQHQGRSIGRLLVEAAFATARELGYAGMVFDTLERLCNANKLYQRLGCRVLHEPFYESPLPGTVYWHTQL